MMNINLRSFKLISQIEIYSGIDIRCEIIFTNISKK